MKVARTVAEMRSAIAGARGSGHSIGFVPTMGALHAGHLSLVHLARERTDFVVMSIFVNPLQFGAGEDFDAYPRDNERDLALAEEAGVDVVFLPGVDEMYPPGRSTTISVGPLSTIVEGRSRPGHFDGVATVVAKLFGIVTPDLAFFGQKDAQQVAVVRKMVTDLTMPVEIVACPTIRESAGLALSSRNVYLSENERAHSLVLWEALQAGRNSLLETGDPEVAEKVMRDLLTTQEGVAMDYALCVDPDTFETPAAGRDRLLVIAARVGGTRLIDNLLVGAGEVA